MVVVARTDATSIDEGILRAKRFHAAGADVTLIDGLPSVEALRRVGEEVPGHKVINLIHGGKTPLLPSQQLHDLGFKIVLYSTPALYTRRAMLETMTRLAQTRDLLHLGREHDLPRLPGPHREPLLPPGAGGLKHAAAAAGAASQRACTRRSSPTSRAREPRAPGAPAVPVGRVARPGPTCLSLLVRAVHEATILMWIFILGGGAAR